MTRLSLIHFNDVYRVQPQKLSSKSSETIDVTQFAALLDDIRVSWAKDGLVLFSGDLFSPSVESTVTRGSHMVPVMNEIAPDAALTGNHDFDFGYPHLTKLIQGTKFPWILSNIIDTTTAKVPEYLHEYQIFERAGVRIGVIGLVEEEWIGTVSSWPPNFEYRDMCEVGKTLSKRLRDPTGDGKCDFIIALTHSRVPNDIKLAEDLLALSRSAQSSCSFAESHGVDILLGGHDHMYYVSRGVDSWEGYDLSQESLGAEADNGNILVIKSGTDFRDLSEISLELEDTQVCDNVVRRKIIKKITGKRWTTKPGSRSSEKLKSVLSSILGSLSDSLKASVATTEVELDLRSPYIRTAESAAGNWFADILLHTYDDALCLKGCGGADAVFITAGTLRGDSVYGPGNIALGNILEILPFEDPLVVLELDGEAIWTALEAGLETWPAQEGRFPVVSGLRVTWDSRNAPGQRVLDVHLEHELADSATGSTIQDMSPDEIKRERGGKKFKVVTRDYIAQGHDGYTALKGSNYLIDDESGQMMSAVVRKYLLGSRFINRIARMTENSKNAKFIQPSTDALLHRERRRRNNTINHWRHATTLAIRPTRSKRHYKDNISVAQNEHMSDVDCFDGHSMREGSIDGEDSNEGDGSNDKEGEGNHGHQDLLQIHPVVDGRFKDIARDS